MNRSLLNVVLLDQFPGENAEKPVMPIIGKILKPIVPLVASVLKPVVPIVATIKRKLSLGEQSPGAE